MQSILEKKNLKNCETEIMNEKILPLNFFVLQIIGFWRPPNWSSTWKIMLYDAYTFSMFFMLYTTTLSQLIQLIKAPGNVDHFINDARVLLTMINACAKSANFVKRRSDIARLIGLLSSSPCFPQDRVECDIQEKYDRVIRINSLIYGGFIQSAVFARILQTAMENAPQRILPFESWLPYNLNSNTLFWFTYFQQTVGTYISSYVSICYDTIIPGFMVQTCVQFEILKKRMQNLCKNDCEVQNEHEKRNSNESMEQVMISNHVQHHLKILEFSSLSNNIFTYTIFAQFSISFLVICVSVYDLSKVQPLSSDFMEVFLYSMAMLLEIFIFCFYGNNVTDESVKIGTHIYSLNWFSLAVPSQKSLLIIMTRAMRPLTFTSGYVVVLSLTSFTALLKLSYSAYSFLQQAS